MRVCVCVCVCVIYKPQDTSMSHALLSSTEPDVDYAIITQPVDTQILF
jgi:hypothetical protein